jgi:voltage-gated potassium channel
MVPAPLDPPDADSASATDDTNQEEPTADDSTFEERPSADPNAGESPSNGPTAGESPSYGPNAEELPSDGPTAGEAPSDDPNAEESPAEDPRESAGGGAEATIVGDPIDADVGSGAHVIVAGYDAWTEPVIHELLARDVTPTVITTDEAVGARLRERDVSVVITADVDEACFRAADAEAADAVLVATLDDQLNVLAVLTVMNVDEGARVVTFAREEQDVPKLRAAGADRDVSLGQALGELLVEVALSERRVDEVVRELVGDRR